MRLLKHAGHSATWARHGEEALALLDEVQPDLVMLDIMMPVMDGFEFLGRLRSDPRWNNVQVIVLTGVGPSLDAKRLTDLGVGEILHKGAVEYHRLLHKLG